LLAKGRVEDGDLEGDELEKYQKMDETEKEKENKMKTLSDSGSMFISYNTYYD
jgi:hypothetical protein